MSAAYNGGMLKGLLLVAALTSYIDPITGFINQKEEFDLESSFLYVERNIIQIREAYNIEHQTNWNACGIETVTPIVVHDLGDNYPGLILDFFDDEGYMVLADNLRCMYLTLEGHSFVRYIEYYDSLHFSTVAGFYYQIGEETCFLSQDEEYDVSTVCGSNQPHYNGQVSNAYGCGRITDTNLYVYDKYGSGYSLTNRATVSVLNPVNQDEYSMYRYWSSEESRYTGEANCWFISAYHVLQYVYSIYQPASLNDTLYYIPGICEPRYYGQIYNSNGDNISGVAGTDSDGTVIFNKRVNDTDTKWSSYFEGLLVDGLYYRVRSYVVNNFSYINATSLLQGTVYNTGGIIEQLSNEVGYKVDVKEHTRWRNWIDEVISQVNSGKPYVWSVASNGYHPYGDHTMAGCGYRIYKKVSVTNGVAILEDTRVFFELCDGWNDSKVWFDATDYIGHTGCLSFLGA